MELLSRVSRESSTSSNCISSSDIGVIAFLLSSTYSSIFEDDFSLSIITAMISAFLALSLSGVLVEAPSEFSISMTVVGTVMSLLL